MDAVPAAFQRALIASLAVHALALAVTPVVSGSRVPDMPLVREFQVLLLPARSAVPEATLVPTREMKTATTMAGRSARLAVVHRDEATNIALPSETEPAPAAVSEDPVRPAAKSQPPETAEYVPPRFGAAYLDNPAPAYPFAAKRQRRQGTVTLRVLVGTNGLPQELRLGASSGSPDLDEAALDAVRGWRFVPARRGRDMLSAWVEVPVRFRLME